MKKLTCYDCEENFEAETSEEMLNLLYPHYMEKHHEVITGNSEEEKKAWMDRFNADWEKAEIT